MREVPTISGSGTRPRTRDDDFRHFIGRAMNASEATILIHRALGDLQKARDLLLSGCSDEEEKREVLSVYQRASEEVKTFGLSADGGRNILINNVKSMCGNLEELSD